MTLNERIKTAAAETEAVIRVKLAPDVHSRARSLSDAMLYSALAGGKRLRPYLTAEFCALCGGSAENAYFYAAAVELMHTMSLIHDDLPAMDDDDLRRGKPSNHKVFGEAAAILAGDALICEVFALLAANTTVPAERNLKAVEKMAYYSGINGMIGGQQIDIESEKKSISESALYELAEKKTAALFSCCCVLGCIAAGAGDEILIAAEQYGKNIGCAFQITDDLLDAGSDPASTGKTPGKDERSGKNTFVSFYGRGKALEKARKYIENAAACLRIFKKCDSLDYLTELAKNIIDRKN